MIQSWEILEQQYENLLQHTLKNLRLAEKKSSASEKDQAILQLITHIEFTLEELHPEIKRLKSQVSINKPQGLYGIPSLPKHPLFETPLLAEVKIQLANKGVEPYTAPIMFQSAAGFGKSLLAAQLAYDTDIQALFPDGIYWISLGKEPDIGTLYLRLAEMAGKPTLGFSDEEQAGNYLQSIFAAKRALLILDDAKLIEHIVPFYDLGTQCRLLVTSTEKSIFDFIKFKSMHALLFEISPFNIEQSQQLFAHFAPLSSTELLESCQGSPLALQLVAATLAISENIKELNQRLNNPEMDLSEQYPPYLMQALHLYLETLGDEGEYYLTLAVFADYTHIPLTAIAMFWNNLFNLSEKQTQEELEAFAEKGLVNLHDTYLSLHSFQHDYILDFSDLDKLQARLLSAYARQCQQGWLNGVNDGYYYDYLCYHLFAAKRSKEIKSLLLDFDWLKHKLEVSSLQSLLRDYEFVTDPDLKAVQQALFDSAADIILDPTHLALQLLNNLWENSSKDIQSLLNQAREIYPAWEPPMPDNDEERRFADSFYNRSHVKK
ncbi:MAG: hypothetical protein RIT27_836 [Pseudomonadota bacterium]|jgi:hypothetical protein